MAEKNYSGKIPNNGACKVTAPSAAKSKRGKSVKVIGRDLRSGK